MRIFHTNAIVCARVCMCVYVPELASKTPIHTSKSVVSVGGGRSRNA